MSLEKQCPYCGRMTNTLSAHLNAMHDVKLMEPIRVDWEGEVQGFYIHADYHMDWDTFGNKKVVVLEKFKAYTDHGDRVFLLNFEDTIAEAIERDLEEEVA